MLSDLARENLILRTRVRTLAGGLSRIRVELLDIKKGMLDIMGVTLKPWCSLYHSGVKL